MKILATQQVEIQIDNEQRHRICLDYLYEKFDWSPDYRISADRVICRTTGHTTHSFDFDVDIRPATDLDRTISLIVCQLIRSPREAIIGPKAEANNSVCGHGSWLQPPTLTELSR